MSIIACFRADKNGSAQTGVVDATFTKLTFSNEVFDVGNYFTSDKWTPPAGIISLTASASTSAGTFNGNAASAIAIYKNGAIFAQCNTRQFGAGTMINITVSDNANGTDFYEAYVFLDTTGGTATIEGSGTYTYFSGRVI